MVQWLTSELTNPGLSLAGAGGLDEADGAEVEEVGERMRGKVTRFERVARDSI